MIAQPGPVRTSRWLPPQSTIAWLGLALFGLVLVRTAWLSDDAFITLRTIDNVANGYGLRWNPAERVQSFTHPLWLLLLTPFYAVTREPFYTTLALQAVLSLATVALLARRVARSAARALLVLAVVISSKAFVDFSTAGLENPLTHILLLTFWIVWQRPSPSRQTIGLLWTITSLVMLCRQDLILLIGPAAVAATLTGPAGTFRWVLAGVTPLVAWEAFSFVYYGVLVPNTALAKVSTGIPLSALAAQGVRYWQATSLFDPITIATIVMGTTVLGVLGGRPGRVMAIGVLLYSAYLIRVGGDFMTGRFFTPVLVWTIAGLAGLPLDVERRRPMMAAWAGAALFLLGLLQPAPPLASGARYGQLADGSSEYVEHFGVADERRFYYSSVGLLRRLGFGGRETPNPWMAAGIGQRRLASSKVVMEASNVGLFGYYAGPNVHIIDRNALCDPLLARLPAKTPWRIGHFTREVPAGYADGWRRNVNGLTDPALHAFYDKIRTLTQEPIWSADRFVLAWQFSLGRIRP